MSAPHSFLRSVHKNKIQDMNDCFASLPMKTSSEYLDTQLRSLKVGRPSVPSGTFSFPESSSVWLPFCPSAASRHSWRAFFARLFFCETVAASVASLSTSSEGAGEGLGGTITSALPPLGPLKTLSGRAAPPSAPANAPAVSFSYQALVVK